MRHPASSNRVLLMAAIRDIVSTVIFFALTYLLVIYFVGETEIKAKFDGRFVKTQVWVNGQYVGETPYKTRLGPGMFNISVLPPEGGKEAIEPERGLEMFSTGLGIDFTADFHSRR